MKLHHDTAGMIPSGTSTVMVRRFRAAVAPVRAAQPLWPCIHPGVPAGRSNAGIAGNSSATKSPPYATKALFVSGFLIARRNCWMAVFHFASICAVAAAIWAGVPPAPSGRGIA